MLPLFALVLFFQTLAPASTGETTTFVAAGIAASFILEVAKGLGKRSGVHVGAGAAHLLTLLLAFAIVVGVKFEEGTLHSWTDLVRSLGIVTMSAVATFHFLVDRLGIDNALAAGVAPGQTEGK
ncbi:MAG: hypothetical protein M3348_18300 [Acidobacteriota bacterium]|nr:hypothetical protein [Acidobacteriota bacterium]